MSTYGKEANIQIFDANVSICQFHPIQKGKYV